MRILDPQAMKVDLEKLGMSEDIITKWKRAIQVPYGLIVVTGPTGSGKTSTLYASLHQLDSKTRNITTVEDPIEYEFETNIAQVQVTERLTFARVMRSFLRQDPDVMLVGEMRDPESLGIGIQAGLTGHLVLTTLHTNNAIETIGRMLELGRVSRSSFTTSSASASPALSTPILCLCMITGVTRMAHIWSCAGSKAAVYGTHCNTARSICALLPCCLTKLRARYRWARSAVPRSGTTLCSITPRWWRVTGGGATHES